MIFFALLLSSFVFANVINSDIQTESVQTELSRYEIQDDVTVQRNGNALSTFELNGVDGGGVTATTVYSELPNWESTLNFRYYRGTNYLLTFYTTGLDYVRKRQNNPFQLTAGIEFGVGNFDIDPLKDHGSIAPAFGYEIHTSFRGYFVFSDRLLSYFIRPALRSYQFQFTGNDGINNIEIDAQGFVLAVGLGYLF